MDMLDVDTVWGIMDQVRLKAMLNSMYEASYAEATISRYCGRLLNVIEWADFELASAGDVPVTKEVVDQCRIILARARTASAAKGRRQQAVVQGATQVSSQDDRDMMDEFFGSEVVTKVYALLTKHEVKAHEYCLVRHYLMIVVALYSNCRAG